MLKNLRRNFVRHFYRRLWKRNEIETYLSSQDTTVIRDECTTHDTTVICDECTISSYVEKKFSTRCPDQTSINSFDSAALFGQRKNYQSHQKECAQIRNNSYPIDIELSKAAVIHNDEDLEEHQTGNLEEPESNVVFVSPQVQSTVRETVNEFI